MSHTRALYLVPPLQQVQRQTNTLVHKQSYCSINIRRVEVSKFLLKFCS